MTDTPQFKVIGEEPETDRFRMCRRMLVGPWCNQPEEYEGYNGFVGWAGATRLRNGRWVVTFSSGYWHASFPLTPEVLADEESRKIFEDYHTRMDCPHIYAPRGGRAHVMTSADQGLTWSRPGTLVDTEQDDRHPTILELDDGTLLCTFFEYRLPRGTGGGAKYMLSKDAGKTWTEPWSPHPGASGFGNGSAILLKDGTVAWAIGGKYDPEHEHTSTGIFRSSDRGETFELAAVVRTDHDLYEATIAELPDGRVVAMARREGDTYWSEDGGRTWTEPVVTGIELYDPHLLMMPNGVLACFHGSYKAGGIRVILSRDAGRTWHGPGDLYGYSVDASVYGYCHPMLLADGSVYLVYLHTGGHVGADPRTEALWGLRVSVHDEADGIEILPAPGSPAEMGLPPEALSLLTQRETGGDPELGEL